MTPRRMVDRPIIVDGVGYDGDLTVEYGRGHGDGALGRWWVEITTVHVADALRWADEGAVTVVVAGRSGRAAVGSIRSPHGTVAEVALVGVGPLAAGNAK